MGFWGKFGKAALKVGKVAAPIALGMTGVGLPAAMAVSGALNAADKKASGGSWKGALGAGLMGAGTAAAGAGLGKMGGFAGKLGSKVGVPIQSGVPKGMENVGRVALPNMAKTGGIGPGMSTFQRVMGNIGTGARTAQDVMGAVGAARGAMQPSYRTPNFNPYMSGTGIMGRGMPSGRMPMGMGRGMGMGSMNRMDQRAPNLAYPLMQGRQEALMNQPFRAGGRMMISPEEMPEEGDAGRPAVYEDLPPIYPNMGRGINPRYMPRY